MKLLLHTPFFYPSVGGIETFADGLAGELHRRGVDVTVLAETPLGAAEERARGYRLLRANPSTRKQALEGADAILSVGPGSRMLPAARRRRLPMVLVHQNPVADCPIGIGWRDSQPCGYRFAKCLHCRVSGQSMKANIRAIARHKVLRWAMKRAAANVYISETIAARAGLPGERIGNFYDPDIFYPDPAIQPDAAFLFVGRLVLLKGVDVAIRGFAAVRRAGSIFRLRIIGDGPERSNLEQLAVAEGVAEVVDFLGPIGGAELAREYRSAWALLFPSQWAEPFGIVMIEAMACGCPVLASDRGACAEVVADGGRIVGAADADAWATAMTAVAANPELRAEWSRRATLRAAEFALLRIADRYLQLLNRLVPR